MTREEEIRNQMFRLKWGTTAEIRAILRLRLQELMKKKKKTDMERGEMDRLMTILAGEEVSRTIVDLQIFSAPAAEE